jgi:ABC-type transport system substrate-binding protein
MKSIKAIAQTTWILIIIVIVLIAALGGVVLYYSGVLTPGQQLQTPGFVNDNVIILEGGNQPQWLDPHVSYYQYDYEILQHSAEMLLWYNGDNSTDIIPWLTDTWTPDFVTTSNTYTVTLREGITFQDGTPFNATAVWFSLNRLLIMDGTDGSGNHGSQAAWILQQLLNTDYSSSLDDEQAYDEAWVKKVLDQDFIEIVDNYTIKINIQMKTTQFPFLLSQPWAAIISPTEVVKREYAYHDDWGTFDGNLTKYFIKAAGVGDTYFNVPRDGWKFGTGPYYLDSYDPTTYRVVLKVNTNYWGGPTNFQFGQIGVPKIKEIDFNYVESFSTRLLDLSAGKATGIGVSTADIYSVVDRDTWLNNGEFKSLIPGVTVHGPFAQFVTDWISFVTNVTDASGKLRTFQPTADQRIRMAFACAVNLTEVNIDVNNRLGQVPNQLIPPGLAPAGSYNPDITTPWSLDLPRAAELLVDAMMHPMTSFTYYNGTRIPAGVIDNRFGDTNGDGKAEITYTIEVYCGAADTFTQKVLTTISTNLNAMAADVSRGGNATGLRFAVVPVPGGQQYTLASRHQIYAYWGGWVADYNHVIDWLGPMYLSSQTYFKWNQMNYTRLDNYVENAMAADEAGDLEDLMHWNDLANEFANEQVLYFYLTYPLAYYVRSSYLKGWYFNVALATEYFAPMHYESTP